MDSDLDKEEIKDLLISWVTISFAFAWAGNVFDIAGFASAVPIALLAVGTGFIFHELAHRYTAIKFGAKARYRMWTTGLFFAVMLSFTGVVFAAPGAVYIQGSHISRKQNGLISMAGPLTNIIVGIGFIFLAAFSKMMLLNQWFLTAFSLAAFINFLLGAFNLIPIGPLDGRKVFLWNPFVWGTMFVPNLVVVLSFWRIVGFITTFL